MKKDIILFYYSLIIIFFFCILGLSWTPDSYLQDLSGKTTMTLGFNLDTFIVTIISILLLFGPIIVIKSVNRNEKVFYYAALISIILFSVSGLMDVLNQASGFKLQTHTLFLIPSTMIFMSLLITFVITNLYFIKKTLNTLENINRIKKLNLIMIGAVFGEAIFLYLGAFAYAIISGFYMAFTDSEMSLYGLGTIVLYLFVISASLLLLAGLSGIVTLFIFNIYQKYSHKRIKNEKRK